MLRRSMTGQLAFAQQELSANRDSDVRQVASPTSRPWPAQHDNRDVAGPSLVRRHAWQSRERAA
jgi:hypothetical protein